jgi:adenosine kinase
LPRVKIAVTGSIATDHLMTFRGRFRDSLVVEQLDKISLSFLADELEIRRGGVAANIAFGMANLGQRPILVGSVGEDFADYRSWLERHGVDCESVHTSDTRHTARFVCTTDDDMAQIATFYAGAMSDARLIELGPIARRVGGLDLVLIGANDPEAMLRHTQECRTRGIPFIADPSQQLAFADGPEIRRLVDGAAYLVTNEYEAHLTEQKTGWSPEEIMRRVDVRIVTRGSNGVTIHRKGEDVISVSVAREVRKADPTGVGDAFRAGFLTGLSGGLDLRRCAELGSMLATYVIETVGTQEYHLGQERFLARLADAYGPDSADEIRPVVACRPG